VQRRRRTQRRARTASAAERANPALASVPSPRGDPLRSLDDALAARAALLGDAGTTAWRVLHDAADGTPGLVIEKLGDVLIVQCHEGRGKLPEFVTREVCAAAQQRLEARAVYRKLFPLRRDAYAAALDASHRSPEPWLGAPVEPELCVRENGVRFLVRPYDGYATGLYLDQRDNRARVRRLAAGRSVLNLFAYTCGFSVAAALGGARRVVTVDSARKALEWGRRNMEANGLAADGQSFVRADVLDYLRRAQRHMARFDLVIVDPPTFARCKQSGGVFSLERDLDRLVAGAVAVLEPGGRLLLSCNHRQTTRARLEQAVARACAATGRRWSVVERLPAPIDFAGDGAYAKSILVGAE
jgi:23S rRNA (cytosine1962-C5)-methyltransferase